jgi:hypothetical protein
MDRCAPRIFNAYLPIVWKQHVQIDPVPPPLDLLLVVNLWELPWVPLVVRSHWWCYSCAAIDAENEDWPLKEIGRSTPERRWPVTHDFPNTTT